MYAVDWSTIWRLWASVCRHLGRSLWGAMKGNVDAGRRRRRRWSIRANSKFGRIRGTVGTQKVPGNIDVGPGERKGRDKRCYRLCNGA